MIMQSKAVVLVVTSFLLVILVYSSVAKFDVFGKPKLLGETCKNLGKVYSIAVGGMAYGEKCCYSWFDSELNRGGVYCQTCYYSDSNLTRTIKCDEVEVVSKGTGLPGRLGTVLPSGNNTGTPGKTSIFNPIRNATNVLPGNISTGTNTLPPGSIFKVPPGTTSAPPTGNNTGTLPALSVTKEHNPASPNVFSSVGNTTSQNNNNTSTLKLSPLEGKQYHHKGSNIAGNNQTKSIQGHSHVTIQNNG